MMRVLLLFQQEEHSLDFQHANRSNAIGKEDLHARKTLPRDASCRHAVHGPTACSESNKVPFFLAIKLFHAHVHEPEASGACIQVVQTL